MTEPARRGASGPDDDPERRPDPRAGGWADVRKALVTEAQAVRLAVEELARRPGDRAALEMARLNLSVMESLGVIACRWQVDEAVIEAERKRAYAEGWRACTVARRRMGIAGGGRAG